MSYLDLQVTIKLILFQYLTYQLCQKRKYPEVVQAAWANLSEYFRSAPRRVNTLVYERRRMAAADVVSLSDGI